MSISAVPKRSRLMSLCVSDCSCTMPPRAAIMPRPIGKSIAAVVVFEIKALIAAAIAPKAMITP